jgi:hypothetical protein
MLSGESSTMEIQPRWSGGISNPLEVIEQIIVHPKGARSTIRARRRCSPGW